MVEQDKKEECSPLRSVYSVFHFIIAIFAIFLSFKCNKGFDLASFLMAICFPYIYVIYKYATADDFCGVKTPALL